MLSNLTSALISHARAYLFAHLTQTKLPKGCGIIPAIGPGCQCVGQTFRGAPGVVVPLAQDALLHLQGGPVERHCVDVHAMPMERESEEERRAQRLWVVRAEKDVLLKQ